MMDCYFKLKQNSVSGNLLQLITSLLSGRFQRVLINAQASNWETTQTGVSQGSIVGPLFFLIFINDRIISIYLLMIPLYF